MWAAVLGAARAAGGSRTIKKGMFNITQHGSMGTRSSMLYANLWPKLEKMLTENAVGICFDLANTSLPSTDKHPISDAFNDFIKNHQLWTKAAFRTPKDRLLKYWIVEGDVKSIKAYVTQTNFRFTNPHLDKWMLAGNYKTLQNYFIADMAKNGETKPPRAKVYDDASLELLYKYKMGFLKTKKDEKFYIRNPKSIDAVLKDKSVYNRVGLMAGGWQKAARDLGGKADANTKPFNQIWANGKGKGYGKIVKVVQPRSITVTVHNAYGNIFGWWEKERSQEVVRKRKAIMDAAFKSIITQVTK